MKRIGNDFDRHTHTPHSQGWNYCLTAGKSTLLDVLSGRKTIGRIEGVIELNRMTATKDLLSKITAFAEQDDEHFPLATVREALQFSASMRAHEPELVDIDKIMKDMELHHAANRLVNSLSRGERKRLTLGVELASQPAVLFAGL
jgi:ABC-type multidrug transport system ATPase subunit